MGQFHAICLAFSQKIVITQEIITTIRQMNVVLKAFFRFHIN